MAGPTHARGAECPDTKRHWLAGAGTANVRTPIRHLPMGAGDVLFFLGGAVCHGAYILCERSIRGAEI